MLDIQLRDNVKARRLDVSMGNGYVATEGRKCRSQSETYNYLAKKAQTAAEAIGRPEEHPVTEAPDSKPPKRQTRRKAG
jgi:hypothetical protein